MTGRLFFTTLRLRSAQARDTESTEEYTRKRKSAPDGASLGINQSFRSVLHQLQKFLVYARVVRQFWMEGRRHHTSLPHQHGIVAAFRQDFPSLANSLDPRRANEDHLQRIAAERTGSFDDGGIDLAAIGVAADCNVNRIEAGLMRVLDFLGQHDRAGTGPECRLAMDKIVELVKSLLPKKLQEGCRLAAGDDKAVKAVEFLGFAHQYGFDTQFFQAPAMRIEIT